jgi:hypothetical protein
MNLVFDGNNLYKIRKELGPRPGGYRVDPDYIREGMARKPMFWDAYAKKWFTVKLGDQFYLDDQGIVRKTGPKDGYTNAKDG